MEVEDITWVGLTTGRSSEKKGHLSVGNGLLGEIVVDDEGVLAVITEVLTDGASGVWSQELERGGLGGGGCNDDGVLEDVLLFEESHNVGNGGSLLADGDVDAVEGSGVITLLVDWLLVDDGVEGDGGLASLSVSNNQLTLSSSDWDLS